jgi:hypothetical protein
MEVIPSAMAVTPRLRSHPAEAFLVVLITISCGGTGGTPPERPPVVRAQDGLDYYLLDHGRYQAFYDGAGALQHIEYDSNGDGRADLIARHKGAKRPYRVEIDADFDGRADRWEDFNPEGVLTRFSHLETGGQPRRWIVVDAKGAHRGYEYDEDGDGRTDRAELIEGGRVARIEIDADRDGTFDRWQDWKGGRLASESLDTDGDGRADRRLLFGATGGLTRVEKIVP